MMLAGSSAILRKSDSPHLNGRSVGTAPERPLLDEVRIWLEGLGALDWAERFAARHSMTLDRLVRPKRGPTHAAVQAACDEFRSVLRDTHALSFPELASGLRLKHHDPVMSSCRRHEVRRVAEFAALVRSEA